MTSCPACGADASGRFCGTCGQLLQQRPPSSPSEPTVTADGSLVELPGHRRDRPQHGEVAPEGPTGPTGPGGLRGVLAVGITGALIAGLLVWLQPDPEVVSAGRWRGDGSGTTSNRAALPEQVLWSARRVGAVSFDRFRTTDVQPLAIDEHVAVALVGGYVVALDTQDGSTRWERYVGWVTPAVADGELFVPSGRGVAVWDLGTGEETDWLATDGQPTEVLVATPRTVAVRLGTPSGSRYGIYRRPGGLVGVHDATHAHVWDTSAGPRMVLIDGPRQTLVEVDLGTGRLGQVVGLDSEFIRSASENWVLLRGNVVERGALVDLDRDERVELPLDLLRNPTELRADERRVTVFGTAPEVRPPPRGSGQALIVDLPSSDIRAIELEPGFGDAIGGRRSGTLTRSGSLVRLIDVTPAARHVRWEEGTDPNAQVHIVDGVVGQFEVDRWRAWDADTGALRFDTAPQDLPGPNRREEVRAQPYLDAGGFVLDATDSLTQVIDPIDGQRVGVRTGVHVATTPEGDLVNRRGALALLRADGTERWELGVGDGIAPGATQVVGDVVAVLEHEVDEAVTVTTYRLADAREIGSLRVPNMWARALHRLGDALVVVGDGVAILDLRPEGPQLRWHQRVAVDPDVTPVPLGDTLTLVGRSLAVDLDIDDGEIRAFERLPEIVHPVVAYEDATIIATTGQRVIAFDARDRTASWSIDVGARITSAPTLAGDRVYVGTEDGLIAVVSRDGQLVTRLDTGHPRQPVVGAPTVANGLIYVFADRGRRLVALGTP